MPDCGFRAYTVVLERPEIGGAEPVADHVCCAEYCITVQISIFSAISTRNGTGAGHGRKKTQATSEPSWLDPRNDRKMPFTDAELDVLARMADTQAWQDLVAEVGEQQAKEVVKQRLAAQDANSLINWQPVGPSH